MSALPVEQSLKFDFDVPRREFLESVGWDIMESILSSGQHGDPIDCPLEHSFFPGLYVRKITMPKGAKIISRVHRTRHPYCVLRGKVDVFIPGFGVQHIEAPFHGVTEPGTQRLLYCHEETVWITYHSNPDDESLEEIEKRIIEDRFNPLLGVSHSEIAHHRNHTQHVISYHD